MISFDYLRSARPAWLQRLFELRVPERMYGALFGMCAALAATAGACAIEKYRLADAQRVEAAYRARFEISQRAIEKSKIYYDRVAALVALDRQVREIAVSGDADARRLSEIANHLPTHAWLTQIAYDSGGVNLEGRAQNLGTVSAVLKGFMHAGDLHNPTLMSAQSVSDRPDSTVVKYAIHVEGTPL